ncbi:hypothetical protein LLE87_31605, partial [Paenibacillus polymyxa]|nr:hypothetical protein [Paenibacillus polymyxa]
GQQLQPVARTARGGAPGVGLPSGVPAARPRIRPFAGPRTGRQRCCLAGVLGLQCAWRRAIVRRLRGSGIAGTTTGGGAPSLVGAAGMCDG